MAGTLYVVATPLGNLEDITLRALRVLKEVALIACEDTRRTRILLTHFGIHVPVTSYFGTQQAAKGNRLLGTLHRPVGGPRHRRGHPRHLGPGLPAGRERRGRPASRWCRCRARRRWSPLFSAAGVPADRFLFDGFLPVKPGRRVHRLEALRDLELTVVCYESPHRILASLQAIAQVFGGARTWSHGR